MHFSSLFVVASACALGLSHSFDSPPMDLAARQSTTGDCIVCPPDPACDCQTNETCFLVARSCSTCASIRCTLNATAESTSITTFTSLPGPSKLASPSGSGSSAAHRLNSSQGALWGLITGIAAIGLVC
ncbi:hypothetical protein C8R45DRAFT_121657 [Mycena sanguinolenta]|nr:hypothetical protein C8R45DRAFT_121657 [Mycena sanguinolenta]